MSLKVFALRKIFILRKVFLKEKIFRVKFRKSLSIVILLIFSSSSFAQNLLSTQDEIALHKTKKSGQSFVLSKKLPYQDQLPQGIKGVDIPQPGYLFSSNLPNGAGEYDGLPQCAEDNVRYLFRSESEDSFTSLDVVVYQFGDSEQKKKASAFGYKAVPYIEGALSNPYRPQGDTSQTIIRILGIQCLPTRVKSVVKNGEKAFEYSEGSIAWEKAD